MKKKVFVIGGSGKIGSYVSNYLAKKNRAFSHFYQEDPEDHFLKYTDLRKNNIYFLLFKLILTSLKSMSLSL